MQNAIRASARITAAGQRPPADEVQRGSVEAGTHGNASAAELPKDCYIWPLPPSIRQAEMRVKLTKCGSDQQNRQ